MSQQRTGQQHAAGRPGAGGTQRVPAGLTAALLAADVAFAFQQTAIVPAITDVQRSLGASSEWSAWLVTVYLMVATVATPAMGRLGDLHGRRRLLLIGLTVFMLGSLGAAAAPDMPALLVFRAIQGVGGSVYPLTLALVRRLLPRERAATVIALSASAFGLGTMLGFVGGGALAEYASWRWIFAAGAIAVGSGIALVLAFVPATRDRAVGSYDLPGTIVLGAATMALLVALTLVVPLGWASPATAALLLATAVAGAAWGRLEVRARDPLIDLQALRTPRVLRANLATIGLGWALFASYLLVPEFARASPEQLHYGLGAPAAAAVGLILLPLAIGQTLAGSVAGAISRRGGARATFAGGLSIMAAALIALGFIRRGEFAVAAVLFALGAGAGAALASSSNVATRGVSADIAAVSSALNSTTRRFAGGVGGQVATILLASITLGGAGTPRFAAYTVAYLIAAAICLAGVVITIADRGA